MLHHCDRHVQDNKEKEKEKEENKNETVPLALGLASNPVHCS